MMHVYLSPVKAAVPIQLACQHRHRLTLKAEQEASTTNQLFIVRKVQAAFEGE